VIQEVVMPEPGEGSAWRERYKRMSDLSMAVVFNAEREPLASGRCCLPRQTRGLC